MNDSTDPRVRVLKAEHADIGARLDRAAPLTAAPQTASEIHDRAADVTDGERMENIEDELEGWIKPRDTVEADPSPAVCGLAERAPCGGNTAVVPARAGDMPR
jgi:hypothetical protein